MKIIGIDPGVTGAIAFLEAAKSGGNPFLEDDWTTTLSHCIDMPTYTRVVGARKVQRKFIDVRTLKECIQAFEPELALVELVRAQPRVTGRGADRQEVGMGATSAFSFGQGFGMVLGLLIGIDVPYRLVQPKAWKSRVGLLGTEKDASREKAASIYSGADLKRKKDHARADAILIAHCGVRIVDERERL